MNREQRRAQLKGLSKKFDGFDLTTGVLEIPIKGSDETVTMDVLDYDSLYNLVMMSERFANINEVYKEDFVRIDSIENTTKKQIELFKLYRVIIRDFLESIDGIFGIGASNKIFGGRVPMPQLIGEFLEDLTPVVQVAASMLQEETGNDLNKFGVATSSNTSKYSADRMGND